MLAFVKAGGLQRLAQVLEGYTLRQHIVLSCLELLAQCCKQGGCRVGAGWVGASCGRREGVHTACRL